MGRKLEPTRLVVGPLVAGGDALARPEGGAPGVVFVRGAAPGDVVDALVDRSGKVARASSFSIVSASPERVAPPCEAFGACGGCDWMHVSPDAQRDAHAAIVRAALPREPDVVVRANDAARALGYRTRARLALRGDGRRVAVGYRRAKSHDVVDRASCVVLDPALEVVLEALRGALAGQRGEGEAAVALGERGLPVVDLRWSGALEGVVLARFERIVGEGTWAGVEVWLDGARAPARIGDARVVTLGGDGEPLVVPSAGFAQAMHETSAALVARAVEMLAPAGDEVLELFAGSGNFTVALARAARAVVAVEADARAAEAARENLARRKLSARVVAADADAFDVPTRTRRVFLDPPRTGAPGAAARIAASRAKLVVYASCDPATLGRDARTLARGGFLATSAETFEMFPQTSHVEALVRFERPTRGAP